MTKLLPAIVSVATIAPIPTLQIRCLEALQRVIFFTPSLGLNRARAADLASCLCMLLSGTLRRSEHRRCYIAALRVVSMLMYRIPVQFGTLFARQGVTSRVWELAQGTTKVSHPSLARVLAATNASRGGLARSNTTNTAKDKLLQQLSPRRSPRLQRNATTPATSGSNHSPATSGSPRSSPGAGVAASAAASAPDAVAQATREDVITACRALRSFPASEAHVFSLADLIWSQLFRDPCGKAFDPYALLTSCSPSFIRFSAAARMLSTVALAPAAGTSRGLAEDVKAFISMLRGHTVTAFEFIQAGGPQAVMSVLNCRKRLELWKALDESDVSALIRKCQVGQASIASPSLLC